MVASFPNLFNIAGPGSTLAFTNALVTIERHVDWIAYLDSENLATIEPTDMAAALASVDILKLPVERLFPIERPRLGH